MPAAIARLTSLALLSTSLLAAPAFAEDAAPGTATDARQPPAAEASTSTGYAPKPAPKTVPIAIGVNLPFGWYEGRAIAGSLYAGIGKQSAIRLNVASWKNGPSLAAEAIAGGVLDAEFEAEYSGRTTDIGVSYVHYSRKLWDGFLFEAGAVRRAKDHRTVDDFADNDVEELDTTTYAARAMIGWSWLIDDWAFVALGVGASMGLERGTETTMSYDEMPMTSDVDRASFAMEGFLRIGGAFEM